MSYPLPGTRFFAAVQHELGNKRNWHDSDDLAMLYDGPFSTAFYRWLHRVLHREFRAQRAWERLTAMLRAGCWSPRQLRLLASVVFAKLALPLMRLELERRARARHSGLVNLISVEDLREPLRGSVKIRHRHEPAPAVIEKAGDDEIVVTFDEPQRAITPGQAAVFYQGDVVVGGAWIA